MDIASHIPVPPKEKFKIDANKNNFHGNGRPRVALKEISNVVNDRPVQGKKTAAVVPTHFAEKSKEPERKLVEVENGGRFSEESLNETTSGKIEEKSRKKGKTFTSTLGERSKAAFQVSAKEKQSDIDAHDADNELAVVEYIDDMYRFYKDVELDCLVREYIHTQPEINEKMRSILVDWLIEVHRKFELMPESLFLTINIVDRFLSGKVVPRRELQLVGISSMLVACKYEEIWAPEVKDLVWISDNAYERDEVRAMEKVILGVLDWYLTVPTPYVFLARYMKCSSPGKNDPEMENMVFFLAELGLMQYQVITQYSPSSLAASAVYAARCALGREPAWTECLKQHSGISEESVRDCAKLLAKAHKSASESKLKAAFKKYSSADRGAVALIKAAESLVGRD